MLGTRSFWPALATVAYVCFAAAQAHGGLAPWVLLVALPLVLSEVWRRTASVPHGEDRVEPSARAALRYCAWGAALWVAARAAPAGRPAFDAAANFGAGTCAVAGLVALARIAAPGGLLSAPRATRSFDAAAFAGLLWGVAVALPATRVILPAERVRLDPLAVDYATAAAGIGSLLVFVAAAWRLRVLRRLELGVGDRAAGALALSITAFAVAVPAAALNLAPPDRLLPIAVMVASLACTWTAIVREPTTVSSALRGILALTILGAPVTLIAGLLAQQAPAHAAVIVLVASALCIGIGLVARAVARPLGPEQSRWLDAIDAARRGALEPEPASAMRAVLVALSKTSAVAGARPELWQNDPEQVLSVDIAGYVHVDRASAPEPLYELALGEPERTLRAETLQALEVRRPEVRPLIAWFDARRAFSVTIVVDEEGPIGFILLPRGSRATPMTLEEARAVRLLADRISALSAVSSALARSRERELAAIARADELDDERQRLEHIIHREAGRNEAFAERAARTVRQSAYSPAARVAIERLERLGRMNASASLVAPPGVDAVGWAAVLHLASPRRGGALVVADGTNAAEQDPQRWDDVATSPLALSDGGTLLIAEAQALPLIVQDKLAQALSRSTGAAARSSILPAGVVVSAPAPLAKLVEQGRVSKALARSVGDAEVRLPTLAERGEDLRALCFAELLRAGDADRKEPLGIDPKALALLIDHSWPGNEAELRSVLVRAAAAASGPVITPADLAAIGFTPELEARPLQVTPLPGPRLGPRPRRAPRQR
jgi:hypothetical protein